MRVGKGNGREATPGRTRLETRRAEPMLSRTTIATSSHDCRSRTSFYMSSSLKSKRPSMIWGSRFFLSILYWPSALMTAAAISSAE